jgi:hypothetical protein
MLCHFALYFPLRGACIRGGKVFIHDCYSSVRKASASTRHLDKRLLGKDEDPDNTIVQPPPPYQLIQALLLYTGMLTYMPRRACPNAEHIQVMRFLSHHHATTSIPIDLH